MLRHALRIIACFDRTARVSGSAACCKVAATCTSAWCHTLSSVLCRSAGLGRIGMQHGFHMEHMHRQQQEQQQQVTCSAIRSRLAQLACPCGEVADVSWLPYVAAGSGRDDVAWTRQEPATAADQNTSIRRAI